MLRLKGFEYSGPISALKVITFPFDIILTNLILYLLES